MASMAATGGDDFLSQVMRVRNEIRDKFLKAHKLLQHKEANLLAKLQKLEEEFIGDLIIQEINHLSITKEGLMTALKGNENTDLLEKSTTPIDASILELELKLQNAKDTYKSVTLEWDVELEDKLSLIGDIQLNMITMPVVTFGEHNDYKSSSPGVFCYPTGLTIDPKTNYLYICDRRNSRIQVFSESFEFLFLISDKMHGPCGICIKHNKVYVTQITSNLLTVHTTDGKYLQSVGGKGKSYLMFDNPRGLDISPELNRIYIAEHRNDRIKCLNVDLSLHSIINNIYGAQDVKLTPEEIVVLSCRKECVSLYSYSHQLIREIIHRGEGYQLKSTFTFVLDQNFNVLITDTDSHCICVYSYRGEFLHKYGKKGEQIGGFIEPRGITISPQGRIIITSQNPIHPIQIF